MSRLGEWIELVAHGIEILAVVMMTGFILFGTARWLFRAGREGAVAYESYRVMLGKSLLIGLELLVAADIIRTVTVEPTLLNLATLGLLIVVRTALGWTLTLEVEGRWPWQGGKRAGRE